MFPYHFEISPCCKAHSKFDQPGIGKSRCCTEYIRLLQLNFLLFDTFPLHTADTLTTQLDHHTDHLYKKCKLHLLLPLMFSSTYPYHSGCNLIQRSSALQSDTFLDHIKHNLLRLRDFRSFQAHTSNRKIQLLHSHS